MLTTRYAVLIRYNNNYKLPGDPIEEVKDINLERVSRCLNHNLNPEESIGVVLTQFCEPTKQWLASQGITMTWGDGSVFCEVLEKYGYPVQHADDLAKLERIRTALKKAEEDVKMPQIITPEEVILCSDEIPILMYLTILKSIIEKAQEGLNKESPSSLPNTIEQNDKKIIDQKVSKIPLDFLNAKCEATKAAEKLENSVVFELSRKTDVRVQRMQKKSISSEFDKRKSISNSPSPSPSPRTPQIEKTVTSPELNHRPQTDRLTSLDIQTTFSVMKEEDFNVRKQSTSSVDHLETVKEQIQTPPLNEKVTETRSDESENSSQTQSETSDNKEPPQNTLKPEKTLNDKNKPILPSQDVTKTPSPITVLQTQKLSRTPKIKSAIDALKLKEKTSPTYVAKEIYCHHSIYQFGTSIDPEDFGGSQRFVQVASWIGKKNCVKLAKFNTYDNCSFENLMKNKSGLVVLFQVEGCIFGAYESVQVTVEGVKEDFQCFVFSLLNPTNTIQRYLPLNFKKVTWTFKDDNIEELLFKISGFIEIKRGYCEVSNDFKFYYRDRSLKGGIVFCDCTSPETCELQSVAIYQFY
ncbi:hypothetical protein EIN_268300 [Entamoeba invadens IP1]|uniref:Uncharacterized protein n=1 Tax=Entamoeba invadens IP1 TaxID=370355 RepID=A0A0A1U827_ENTIV|nr:hypothetical protein EIN_268300 [Entamoeba invadens IP1]ELP91084.1 hypothetical protein EIN_268300 [Entamoeba invadens IP1]|eukprot:XP_004257855.1 hypothetical protein EIN_268300 [Entamoeba invadens IP1]